LPAFSFYKVECGIIKLLQGSETVHDNNSQHFTTAPRQVWLVMSSDWDKHAIYADKKRFMVEDAWLSAAPVFLAVAVTISTMVSASGV